MTYWLKQSTAASVPAGPFLAETDGYTSQEGLTSLSGIIYKHNAASATINPAVIHTASGYYNVPLDSGSTGTVGMLRLAFANSSSHLPVWEDYMVVTASAYDSLVAGTDLLGAELAASGITASKFQANAIHAAAVAASTISACKFAANAIDAPVIASSAISAAKIAGSAITAATFQANAINATVVAASTISACKFAANAIDAPAIAACAIGPTEVAASVITSQTFAAGAINPTVVAASTITASTLAANSIHAAAVAASTVTACKIGACALDVSHLAATWADKQADHVLRREWGEAASSPDGDAKGGRSLLGAAGKLVNKIEVTGGCLVVYEADDSTVLFRQPVTACDAASPIVALDTT